MNLHFNSDPAFKVRNIQANECPACALKGVRRMPLTRVTQDEHLAKIRVFEQSDIDVLPEEEKAGKVVADSKTVEELRTKYEHK